MAAVTTPVVALATALICAALAASPPVIVTATSVSCVVAAVNPAVSVLPSVDTKLIAASETPPVRTRAVPVFAFNVLTLATFIASLTVIVI